MTQFDEIVQSDDDPVRHHTFYFDDGNVILNVQGVLFKIHKYFLIKYSPVFEDLFRMKSPLSQPEGLSDQSPITLRGDDPVDFCRLFRLFYHDDPGNAVCLNAEQWVSILILAHKYEMTLLLNTAVLKLQVANPRLDPVKQIKIARKYFRDELINEPFKTLVARENVLSREEIAQMPLDDLHRLIVAREASIATRNHPTLNSNPTHFGFGAPYRPKPFIK